MDCVVKMWLISAITADLANVVLEHGTFTCAVQLAIDPSKLQQPSLPAATTLSGSGGGKSPSSSSTLQQPKQPQQPTTSSRGGKRGKCTGGKAQGSDSNTDSSSSVACGVGQPLETGQAPSPSWPTIRTLGPGPSTCGLEQRAYPLACVLLAQSSNPRLSWQVARDSGLRSKGRGRGHCPALRRLLVMNLCLG